ncbi:hypothetical protein OZX67_03760 [Bifidobacterium sp. ESL0728]|uniref:hypothetical protein n=1 Tax=Bifidobacterium sp. ESL0728 TaxID=2983220 RepID=UPI0023F89EFF|nr:hypothetical protein [Bifidobacterium sp. ESL0728]WEV59663.1 hypothetical protein OZX67_03760 [Bifidobacterium sp. ESL0728]
MDYAPGFVDYEGSFAYMIVRGLAVVNITVKGTIPNSARPVVATLKPAWRSARPEDMPCALGGSLPGTAWTGGDPDGVSDVGDVIVANNTGITVGWAAVTFVYPLKES